MEVHMEKEHDKVEKELLLGRAYEELLIERLQRPMWHWKIIAFLLGVWVNELIHRWSGF